MLINAGVTHPSQLFGADDQPLLSVVFALHCALKEKVEQRRQRILNHRRATLQMAALPRRPFA